MIPTANIAATKMETVFLDKFVIQHRMPSVSAAQKLTLFHQEILYDAPCLPWGI